MFKLIFFIYILFNFNIAQTSSNEIHVRYNDQKITFKRVILELMSVSKVANLVKIIKMQLQGEVLSSEIPIDGLYNTKEEALHVVVGKHNIQLNLL